MQHLEVDRTDFRRTRIIDAADPVAGPGEAVLRVERFALTANNISYAVTGDMLDYWGFFPTEAPWGRVPVMGFGQVIDSGHDDVPVGLRVFGFFPMSGSLVVSPDPRPGGFVDRAPHRQAQAPAYRTYDDVAADPALAAGLGDRLLLFRGLYTTSFLVEDFLWDASGFGAEQAVVTSASSKTSIALAHLLRLRGAMRVVGLTSPANVGFVEGLGLYDQVVPYEAIESLEPIPSVVVDMAGNGEVLARVHHRFGDALRYSCRVGATHWERLTRLDDLPGPSPTFFFAPAQLEKRGAEWGHHELDARIGASLGQFLGDTQRWLDVRWAAGADAVRAAYVDTLEGRVPPDAGLILSMAATADDIPVAYTPTGGYVGPMPVPVLAGCTEPLPAGAPDLRGLWRVASVEVDGAPVADHRVLGHLQRVEQCGDRLVVTASGVVHDMRCDGTEASGVHDVAEFDKATPITVVATYEDGVHVLRPVGLPIEVTRRREGDQMVWQYLDFTAKLTRLGPPEMDPPA